MTPGPPTFTRATALGRSHRRAPHPGETFVKPLPWRKAGHRQTSERGATPKRPSCKGDKLPVEMDHHEMVLCESVAVVHEPTVANRIGRVAFGELVLTQGRPVADGDEPGALEGNPSSMTLSRDTLPRVLHWRHCSLCGRARKVRRRTHDFTSALGVAGGDEPAPSKSTRDRKTS